MTQSYLTISCSASSSKSYDSNPCKILTKIVVSIIVGLGVFLALQYTTELSLTFKISVATASFALVNIILFCVRKEIALPQAGAECQRDKKRESVTTQKAILQADKKKSHNKGPLPLKERRIAVLLTPWQDGKGDFSAAFKIIQILHNDLKVPKEKMALFTFAPKNCESFNKENWKIISFNNDFKAKLDSFGAELLIVAPVLSWKKNVVKFAVPKVFISEYGVRESCDDTCRALGLGKQDLGIFIDDELRKSNRGSLENLASINPCLQQAILGEHFYQPDKYSSFLRHCRFYFGYGKNKSSAAFIASIVYKTFNLDKRNLHPVFFMPGYRLKGSDIKLFHECGAKKIKFINFVSQSESPHIEFFENGINEEPDITIISARNVPRDQFIALFKSAEPESLVTGDQSFSEGVSLGKCFLYGLRDHKKDFFKDFLTIVEEEAGKEFANLVNQTAIEETNEYDQLRLIDIKNLATFFLLCSTTYQDKWKKIIERISTKHDMRLQFESLLKLALKNDPLMNSNKLSYADLDPKPFEGDVTSATCNLPFDTTFVFNGNQTNQLKLKFNGKSDLAHFSDSTFTFESWDGPQSYLITRRKCS